MKMTLAGAAALAILAVAHGAPSPALAQTAPTGTGVRGGVNGQGPTGFTEAPGGRASGSAMPRASRQDNARREDREERRQTSTRARPTDPRDRAYMDGGMVGSTTGSDSMSAPGPGGMTGGGGMGMPGGGPAGRVGSTTGTGPGATGGVGSGNQPGTGGTTGR